MSNPPLGSDKENVKTRTKIVASPDAEWIYHADKRGMEYISIGKGIGVAKTKELREGLLLDLDAEGKVTGIEIIS